MCLIRGLVARYAGTLRAARLIGVAMLVAALVACGGGGSDATPTPVPTESPTPVLDPQGNLLVNSGFEAGEQPWISLVPDTGFELAYDAAFTGTTSAKLVLDSPPGDTGSKVYYLVQEISPSEFPETLAGAYRVTNWQRGTAKQYLQVVVIAFGPTNFPTDAPNWQIRYVLAGVPEPPLEIANAKYIFFSDEDPKTDQWLAFRTNVKEDFEKVWGMAPEGFSKIRVLFEVRYDDKVETDPQGHAEVWYDDLYLGSKLPE